MVVVVTRNFGGWSSAVVKAGRQRTSTPQPMRARADDAGKKESSRAYLRDSLKLCNERIDSITTG